MAVLGVFLVSYTSLIKRSRDSKTNLTQTMILRPSAMSRTQIMPFFVSLLAANLLQSVGGALNLRWIVNRAVDEGTVCIIQGAVKQAGNVGTAVWYVMPNHTTG